MNDTEETVRALLTICTRNEAGRHFTEVFPEWKELEESGLIDVYRPVHSQTGIPYSQEYWSVEVTWDGLDLISSVLDSGHES